MHFVVVVVASVVEVIVVNKENVTSTQDAICCDNSGLCGCILLLLLF